MNVHRLLLVVLTPLLMASTSAAMLDGPVSLDSSLRDTQAVDVARMTTSAFVSGEAWFAVWEDRTSSVSARIVGQEVSPSGDLVGSQYVLAEGDVSDPCVIAVDGSLTQSGIVGNGGSKHWMVAWEALREDGTRTVQCAAVHHSGAGQTPVLDLGAASLPDAERRRPDLGRASEGGLLVYEQTGAGLRFLVVEVVSGHPGHGEELAIASQEYVLSADPRDVAPAIDASNVGYDTRYCVWRRESVSRTEIIGRKLGDSGPWLEFVLAEIDTPGVLGDPDVASTGKDSHFAVWSGGYGTPVIRGRRFFNPTNSPFEFETLVQPELGATVTIAGESSQAVFSDPAIAGCQGQYTVAYNRSSALADSIHAVAIDPISGSVLEQQAILPSDGAFAPAVATLPESSTNPSAEVIVIAAQKQPDWPGDHDPVFQLLEPVTTPWTLTAFTCHGGWTHASAANAGNPDFRLELWNAQPFAPTFFTISAAGLELPVGSGTLAVDLAQTLLFVPVFTGADGYASFGVPLPEGLAGSELHFQAFVFAGQSACSGTAFDFSSGNSIVVAPNAMTN